MINCACLAEYVRFLQTTKINYDCVEPSLKSNKNGGCAGYTIYYPRRRRCGMINEKLFAKEESLVDSNM
jgi:hypothetical protein